MLKKRICRRTLSCFIILTFLFTSFSYAAAAGTAVRTGVPSKYVLELNDEFSGFLTSYEGGDAYGDVVTVRDNTNITNKRIDNVKYNNITFTFSTGMSRNLYQWIKDFMDRKSLDMDGAIVVYDFNYKELSRINFNSAIIAEVDFPALDASSKEAGKITMTIAPESTEKVKASASVGSTSFSQKALKKWAINNFRLNIDGLGTETTIITKIDEISVKATISESDIGDVRETTKLPVYIDYSNLEITYPDGKHEALDAWFERNVIEGGNEEKSGSLEYFLPGTNVVIFKLSFHNLGIFSMHEEKVEANSTDIKRIKSEIYCEKIDFTFSDSLFK